MRSMAALRAAGPSAREAAGAAAPTCGLAALSSLCLVARLHHVSAEPEALRHQLGLGSSDSLTVSHLLLAGQRIGLKVKHSRSTAERLPLLPLPALALLGDGRVVVLAQCDTQRVLMLDPAAGGAQQTPHPVIQPLQAFCEAWTGELILVTSRASLAGELARFDFSWFIPSLVRHRKLIGEVLLVSLFLQLFALVTPLFFQVVMDKVLVHRGVATLDVLVVGLVAVVLFESVLNGLRSYDGLAGNDALTDNSTTSNDIYRWGVGYGVDTITDSGGTDRVEFGAGITAAQLLFAHVGNNLEVTISGNSSDKLVVSSYYVGTANKIEDFRLSNGSSVPGGQLPASIVSRDTFAAGDDREPGPSRETIGPVAGRSSQLTAVGLPSRWPYLSKQSLSPTMRDSVEEIEPGAGRWMSFTAPGTLLQQVNVLLSAMAAFDVDSDAAMDTERQTVQPVHGRDVMWVSPAIS